VWRKDAVVWRCIRVLFTLIDLSVGFLLWKHLDWWGFLASLFIFRDWSIIRHIKKALGNCEYGTECQISLF